MPLNAQADSMISYTAPHTCCGPDTGNEIKAWEESNSSQPSQAPALASLPASCTLVHLIRQIHQRMDRLAQSRTQTPPDQDQWEFLGRRAADLVTRALGMTPLERACSLTQVITAPEHLHKAYRHPDLDWAPLSRILGQAEFAGHTFALGPHTLDPRWETQGLVQAVLDWIYIHKAQAAAPGTRNQALLTGAALNKADLDAPRASPLKLLDLGTGSGCILISLLRALPQALGVGTECAPQALAYACHNAHTLGVSHRSCWKQGNWYQALAAPAPQDIQACQLTLGGSGTGGTDSGIPASALGQSGPSILPPFDVIISNPPYIPAGTPLDPEVTQWDPPAALFGGSDGLDAYRTIIKEAPTFLTPGGLLALEIGHNQGPAVVQLARQAGFVQAVCQPDAQNRDRYVLAWQLTGISCAH